MCYANCIDYHVLGFKYSRFYLRDGFGSELALEGQLVQLLCDGRLLDHGHLIGLLPLSRHREALFRSLDYGG
jgi:hypothetical protein